MTYPSKAAGRGRKIVVVGGSGLIGAQVVTRLRADGFDALAASPSSGIDAVTGAGLADALADAAVVVDVSNSPSFEAAAVLAFFETSTRNLLAAEAAAGVGHHVALSVVGADRVPDSAYLRAKLAQERLIEASGAPYTILRATQFFEFARSIADISTVDGSVRLPTGLVRPIAAAEVAAAVAEIAAGEPQKATLDLAGPESFGLDEFARRVLQADGDPRQVVADDSATYFGAVIDDRSLVPGGPDARLGSVRLADWLAQA